MTAPKTRPHSRFVESAGSAVPAEVTRLRPQPDNSVLLDIVERGWIALELPDGGFAVGEPSAVEIDGVAYPYAILTAGGIEYLFEAVSGALRILEVDGGLLIGPPLQIGTVPNPGDTGFVLFPARS